MNWQINVGFIILGVLLIAIFAWKRFRKARLLGSGDIVLIGFGIGALFEGLFGLFGLTN